VRDEANLEQQISSLDSLSRDALKERWASLYQQKIPKSLPLGTLRLAIAYRMQEKALGGLRVSTRRKLLDFAEQAAAGEEVKPSRKLRPSTVLVREWHGVQHTVTVLDHGVAYQGKHYRSLSKVARVITGSYWSGPQFFGLRSKRVVGDG
jgi:hypothetical protein